MPRKDGSEILNASELLRKRFEVKVAAVINAGANLVRMILAKSIPFLRTAIGAYLAPDELANGTKRPCGATQDNLWRFFSASFARLR